MLERDDIIDAGTAASQLGTEKSRAFDPTAGTPGRPDYSSVHHGVSTEHDFSLAEDPAGCVARTANVVLPTGAALMAYGASELFQWSDPQTVEAVVAAAGLGIVAAWASRLHIIHATVNWIADRFSGDAHAFDNS